MDASKYEADAHCRGLEIAILGDGGEALRRHLLTEHQQGAGFDTVQQHRALHGVADLSPWSGIHGYTI